MFDSNQKNIIIGAIITIISLAIGALIFAYQAFLNSQAQLIP